MHNARSNSEDSDVLRVTLANVPSDVDKDRIGWQVDCFSSSIKCALGLTRRERSERHSAGASSLPLPPMRSRRSPALPSSARFTDGRRYPAHLHAEPATLLGLLLSR